VRYEWSEADHQEVQSWQWDHIIGQFSQTRIDLSWKPEATRNCGHGWIDEAVQVTMRGTA
jgi:hypothetical protein